MLSTTRFVARTAIRRCPQHHHGLENSGHRLSTNSVLAQLRRQGQQTSISVSSAFALRWYSPSGQLWKEKNENEKINSQVPKGEEDESKPSYEVINNAGLSDAEIEAILDEEERRLEEEYKSKFVENWKPGMRKRPPKYSYSLDEMLHEIAKEEALEGNGEMPSPPWTLRDKRCGALAIKVGMMPVYDEVWGVRHPCTVLYLDSNFVLGHKTLDKHGYWAVQLAAGERKAKNVGKCIMGQYQKIMKISDSDASGEDNDDGKIQNPPYLVREFRVTDPESLVPIHTKIHARHFVPGQNLDIAGTSKGKGFAGAMKRHGFKGQPASHGVSKSHRALGSTGQCQDPGRVFKGKKMAGRMGGKRVTVQNLRVVKVDRGRNLLFVSGAVPGNVGGWVEIRDAVKKPLWKTNLVQESLDRPPLPTFAYDEAVDGCGRSGHEEWMPMPDQDPLVPDLEYDAA